MNYGYTVQKWRNGIAPRWIDLFEMSFCDLEERDVWFKDFTDARRGKFQMVPIGKQIGKIFVWGKVSV